MFRFKLIPLSLSGVVLIAALMFSGGSAFAEDSDSANGMMPHCREGGPSIVAAPPSRCPAARLKESIE